MKALILAAGRGSRMNNLTAERPKCLVELDGKSLLEYQLDVLRSAGISDIGIVTGYKREMLIKYGLKEFHNALWAETNMVRSLFCAEDEMNSDLIIAYGDIVYSKKVLLKLMLTKSPISVVIDKDWEKYWNERFNNPLLDAESLKLSTDRSEITEIGKNPSDINEIEGQYIGLMKFTKVGLRILKSVYYKSIARGFLVQRKIENAFMTDMLQEIIDSGYKINPVLINGEWIEIDTIDDLKLKITMERMIKIKNKI